MSNTIEIMGDRASAPELGEMAQAIVDYGAELEDVAIYGVRKPQHPSLLVYARRTPDTLAQAVDYCEEHAVPLAFLSSDIDTSSIEPQNFAFIKMPNAALRIINYMRRVRDAGNEMHDWGVVITEHHQPSKADVSGTAMRLAEMLGDQRTSIVSVRNAQETNYTYNIPTSAGEGYAVHSVQFTDPRGRKKIKPMEIVLSGRHEYAEGVVDLFRAIQDPGNDRQFSPGIHDIVELVDQGIVKNGS